MIKRICGSSVNVAMGLNKVLSIFLMINQLQTITKSQWIKLIKNNKNYCKAKCQH